VIFLPFFSAASEQTHSLLSVRMAGGSFVALFTMIVIPLWMHPMRKRLLHWFFERVPA
jgi:hypothetical protein